jgi:3-O-alpha-D-mannopyranosyl-alpha-D-mannopyranose xylosylphosphotransferase
LRSAPSSRRQSSTLTTTSSCSKCGSLVLPSAWLGKHLKLTVPYPPQPHTTADFGSPLLGPNLRLGDTFGYTIPYWEDPAVGCEHEWSSLLRSNWLLSRRFGFRSRLPFKHVAKTLSRPLLAEMHAIWPTQFASAAQRRFREQATGRFGDLNTSWLSSFLLIERSREAMLWVWAVARLGGVDGRWGAEERQAIKSLLGLTHGPSPDPRPPPEQPSVTTVEVKLGPRTTLDRVADGFAGLGIEGHMSTYPLWCA